MSSPRVSVVLVQKSERVYVYTTAKIPPACPRCAWIWMRFVSDKGVGSVTQRTAGDYRCHARENRRYIDVSWCLDAFPSVRETACFCGCIYYHSEDNRRAQQIRSISPGKQNKKKRCTKLTLKCTLHGLTRVFVLSNYTKAYRLHLHLSGVVCLKPSCALAYRLSSITLAVVFAFHVIYGLTETISISFPVLWTSIVLTCAGIVRLVPSLFCNVCIVDIDWLLLVKFHHWNKTHQNTFFEKIKFIFKKSLSFFKSANYYAKQSQWRHILRVFVGPVEKTFSL